MPVDKAGLRNFFRNFVKSAFRLETHQVYTIPSEAERVRRFLAGQPKDDESIQEWRRLVEEITGAGKTMTRVKIVRRPFTDYTRYLMEWGVPRNVRAGEDYRILDLTDREVDLPQQDFWLFDETTVLLLNFNPDGTLRDRELVESPSNIDQYLRWRDLALAEAVPFGEYRA
ncbi:DUF6879 family protein [Streptoalloteichus hindustanus]|uniref:DUF6879 domain-containing protein n=1 Tax=Streptoalloteichus hindustanus TaxID=2017 RepID=A0A1M5A8B0_STRHI|nr:DUF6879 family protein [Streptoalloteichus hindustanus]SHF26561.1 hypothetical protein SAMN05444320_10313 [Streptoalloteichus hindustanus]